MPTGLPPIVATEGMGLSNLRCLLNLQQALYDAASLLVVTSRHVARLSWPALHTIVKAIKDFLHLIPS